PRPSPHPPHPPPRGPRPTSRSSRYRPEISRSGTPGPYPEPDVRHAAYLARVRVVGIDPGTATCGYAVVEEERGRLHELEHGCWRTSSGTALEARLKRLFDEVRALISRHGPDAVAL